MMKLLFTYLFLSLTTLTSAQVIDKAVLASGGEAMTNGEIQLNSTVGEPLIGLVTDDLSVDQGFWTGSLLVEPMVTEDQLGGIIIYPNPVGQELNLFTNNHPVYGITLFSVDGRMVRKEKVETSETQHRIDASTLSQGVYVLQVFVEGETEEKLFKVIKN